MLQLDIIRLPKGTTALAKGKNFNAVDTAKAWRRVKNSSRTALEFFKGTNRIDKITEEDATQEKKTFAFVPVDTAAFAYTLPTLVNAAGIDGDGNSAFAEVGTPLGMVTVPIIAGNPPSTLSLR